MRLRVNFKIQAQLQKHSYPSVNQINKQLPSDLFQPIAMHAMQSSPLHHRKNSNHSPQKLSNSINLYSNSKSPQKVNVSPRKLPSTSYTVHHEQKLKVYVKFKPPSASPQFLNVTYLNDKQVQIERQSTNNKIYSYDKVFHQSITSQKVFAQGCAEVVDQMLGEGENGLIFVYGHTGTGKTYTMGLLDTVDNDSKGIVPETLRYIFKVKQRHEQMYPKNSSKIQISLSFNEIYMDEVYDMLDFENDRKLQIRQNQSNKQPYIENNISILVNNVEEAYQLVNIGLQKRRVGEQKINKRSSRGHGLITLSMLLPNGKSSRLCFVDLAGSERVKESESIGKTLKQAVHINTSLSALEALLMNIDQQSVRMYRGNKLTRLLQPFLECGKIRLFVTSNYENIQPLQFAKRCKGIKFMQKQVVEPPPIQTKSPSFSKVASQPDKLKQKQISKQIDKLKAENKTLTQLLTNTIVILNKLNKLVLNLIDQQNIQSTFSLSNDFSLTLFNHELEDRINQRINEIEQGEEEIIERYGKISGGKEKSDSVNTSASNNKIYQSTLLGNQLQALLSCLPNQTERLHSKLNELGFGIFQSVKQLSALCEYRNVYKKEVFTYGIKEDLLSGKNKQLETAVNCLLKHLKNYENGNGFNRILRQLKQIGIQISGNIHKNANTSTTTSKIKPTNNRVKTQNEQSSSSPISKSIPTIIPVAGNTKKHIEEFLPNLDDEEELFGAHENFNTYNRTTDRSLDKVTKSGNENKGKQIKEAGGASKGEKGKITENMGKSAKRVGGLILIEDL